MKKISAFIKIAGFMTALCVFTGCPAPASSDNTVIEPVENSEEKVSSTKLNLRKAVSTEEDLKKMLNDVSSEYSSYYSKLIKADLNYRMTSSAAAEQINSLFDRLIERLPELYSFYDEATNVVMTLKKPENSIALEDKIDLRNMSVEDFSDAIQDSFKYITDSFSSTMEPGVEVLIRRLLAQLKDYTDDILDDLDEYDGFITIDQFFDGFKLKYSAKTGKLTFTNNNNIQISAEDLNKTLKKILQEQGYLVALKPDLPIKSVSFLQKNNYTLNVDFAKYIDAVYDFSNSLEDISEMSMETSSDNSLEFYFAVSTKEGLGGYVKLSVDSEEKEIDISKITDILKDGITADAITALLDEFDYLNFEISVSDGKNQTFAPKIYSAQELSKLFETEE